MMHFNNDFDADRQRGEGGGKSMLPRPSNKRRNAIKGVGFYKRH
jgi:hypothetical protein